MADVPSHGKIIENCQQTYSISDIFSLNTKPLLFYELYRQASSVHPRTGTALRLLKQETVVLLQH